MGFSLVHKTKRFCLGCLREMVDRWLPESYSVRHWLRRLAFGRLEERIVGSYSYWDAVAGSRVQRCDYSWVSGRLVFAGGEFTFWVNFT